MKPPPFGYRRARSVTDAVGLLSELGPDAKVLGGGQSLLPLLAFRLARPSHLIDISGLAGLSGLTVDGDGLTIGALTTHHDVETSTHPDLVQRWPVIRSAMKWIGHLPIRTMGTVGGSVAHGDALAEWTLLTILLDAVITVQGPRGERDIAAADFYQGFFTTTLEHDEIVVAVRFPHDARQAAFTEYAQRRGDYAIVSAAVAVDGAGRARIALGGVAEVPIRVAEAEKLLQGAEGLLQGVDPAEAVATADAIGAAAAQVVDPPSDQHGSSGYRRELVQTLVGRAVVAALAPAAGGAR